MLRLFSSIEAGRVLFDPCRVRSPEGAEPSSREELDQTMKRVAPRWFVVRDTHASLPPLLSYPRETKTWNGPMTRGEIRRVVQLRADVRGGTVYSPTGLARSTVIALSSLGTAPAVPAEALRHALAEGGAQRWPYWGGGSGRP